MPDQITFLGTGSSLGIPVIGCQCEVCLSSDPHNQRLRTSALLQVGGKRLLIDPGPDFRAQALKAQIHHLDGVIVTHAHFDHIGGMDELRVYYFSQGRSLPCLLSRASYQEIKQRLPYLSEPPQEGKSVAAQLDFQVVPSPRDQVCFEGVEIQTMSVDHGEVQVMGVRIKDFAYISDIQRYPQTIFEDLKGVKTMVISALRNEPSAIHFTIEEAVEFLSLVGVERGYLVHMSHDLDHAKTNATLPSNVELAYDGLTLSLE